MLRFIDTIKSFSNSEIEKIKEISKNVTNDELEDFVKNTEGKKRKYDHRLYSFILEDRKERNILFVKYYDKFTGRVSSEEWFLNGKLDSRPNGGPAWIHNFLGTNQIQFKQWYINGQLHRLGWPASIKYFEDGKIESEEWFVDGQRNRPSTGPFGGPAIVEYFESGDVKTEYWYKNGKKHMDKSEGVAFIRYYKNGVFKEQKYYENDIELKDDDIVTL